MRTTRLGKPSPLQILDSALEERVQIVRRDQTQRARYRLIDFICAVSPHLQRPRFMWPYLEQLERAVARRRPGGGVTGVLDGGNLRVAVAAPPQHGKTQVTLHAFLWWAEYYPGRNHAYITYNTTRAEEVAKDFRDLAARCGYEPTGNLDVVELRGGTRIKFGSIQSGLTGYTIDGCCVIDDPIKDQKEARSPTVRKNAIDWYISSARTRRHPGTSFVAMATRWHQQDLSGYLIKSEAFKYINLKAIATPRNTLDVDSEGRVLSDPLLRFAGQSLWPEHKPPEFFAEEQKNAYWWAAMFQGEPLPEGGAVFKNEPAYYLELPRESLRGAYGLDLAFSVRTSADWSICLEGVMAYRDFDAVDEDGKPCKKSLPVLFITDIIRKQVASDQFALVLKAKRTKHSNYKMRWYAYGPEKGVGDLMSKNGIKIDMLSPPGDKLTRSARAAEAWNDKNPDGSQRCRVLLPDPTLNAIKQEDVEAFLEIVRNFTGQNDVHDDDVDALAALWDELEQKPFQYGHLQ